MDLTINKTTLFPIEVIDTYTPINCSPLIDELYNIKQKHPKGVQKSNANGYQTEDDLHNNSIFKPLVSIIQDVILEGINRSCFILNMWGNISPSYAYNHPHHHELIKVDNILSGVFYLQVNPYSGNIQFYCPYNIINYVSFTPYNHCMLIFPQNLIHSVDINQSKEDRISIAFNLQLT